MFAQAYNRLPQSTNAIDYQINYQINFSNRLLVTIFVTIYDKSPTTSLFAQKFSTMETMKSRVERTNAETQRPILSRRGL